MKLEIIKITYTEFKSSTAFDLLCNNTYLKIKQNTILTYPR